MHELHIDVITNSKQKGQNESISKQIKTSRCLTKYQWEYYDINLPLLTESVFAAAIRLFGI